MKKGHLVIAVVAVVLFTFVIAHMRLPSMMQQLKAIRIALPSILALSAVRLYLQSSTWATSLKGQGIPVDKTRLAEVRLASQAMGYLTVLGPVLSEPMKINLLGTPSEATITGTFLDDGVYWFTSALIAVAGILSLPLAAAHGAIYHWIPPTVVLFLTLLITARRNSILSGVVRALGDRAPSWLLRAEKSEASIRTFRLEHRAMVSKLFWMSIACQFLFASEVVVVLWALHLPIHFFAVLAIEGVTRALKFVSGWIPARLGSDEGGAISAFAMAGFSPTLGLALALTRRVRDLLGALIGVVWLAWNSRAVSDHREAAGGVANVIKEVF